MIRARKRPCREPTIALINIVFLMLVFFMVAGTLANPRDPDLTLVRTVDLDGRPPPDAVIVHADGRLVYAGVKITSAKSILPREEDREDPEIRLVPDRDLPARELVRIASELRQAGAGRVWVVTERALK